MSTIFIFDRYGKLLKQISPTVCWNGTFNGYPLLDDYWYTVKLEDGREVKGHFSLRDSLLNSNNNQKSYLVIGNSF
jgi:gliding motility-associated-like protein